jgi:ribosome biogenesis GTPase / thiamine phosphate phosphatase
MCGLSALGFSPFFERQLQPSDGDAPILARIAAQHRNLYKVLTREGGGFARLAGRLRQTLADEHLPCVGDWVILDSEPAPDRTPAIERVLARRSAFTRGVAGRQSDAQTVAANIETAFVVCGLDGDFNLHRVERFIARIWASGAQPIVVLNKADVNDTASVRAAAVGRRCAGVPVLTTSARLGEGMAALRACIHEGETAVFVGSSGVGKSSLINALTGEARMPTGEVRPGDDRGRHVTTHRQLVPLPQGGLLLDTPGMRELQLVDDDGLDAVFGDIAALAAQCRFRNCRHDGEPGCAVEEAVSRGQIPAERLEHYRKLEHEAAASDQRRDARLRRQEGRRWGQLQREGRRLRCLKGHLD